MNEIVVLVDENDKEIGTEEKIEAHREGRLHRAFSIFIFNSDGEMLLQRRAYSKYHSGGLWTNTCCSHPRMSETTAEAAHRRLKEELGFDCELKELGHFIYKAKLDHGLTEHELDHVFVGSYDGVLKPSKNEVSEIMWIKTSALRERLRKNPGDFTEWFKIEFKRFPELSRGAVKEQ
jgi:isopentenyl-diphosphate delta-isomerase